MGYKTDRQTSIFYKVSPYKNTCLKDRLSQNNYIPYSLDYTKEATYTQKQLAAVQPVQRLQNYDFS